MAEQMKPSGIDWIGDMPSSWALTKIRYSTALRTESALFDPNYKFIGLENVSSYTGQYIETESEYELVNYSIYKKGDVLFSKLQVI